MKKRTHSLLSPADTIAIAAPASCVSKIQFEKIKKFFKQKNIPILYKQEVIKPLPASKRAEIFLSYLKNPNVKLIWALRGGEGSADIIPFLEKKLNRSGNSHIAHLNHQTKSLVGFSDITALLIYLSQRFHLPVIHGAVARQLALKEVNAKTSQLTLDYLFKNKCIYLNDLKPFNAAAKKIKTIRAKIIGGNLSLIEISIKDVWEIKAKNKILFLEDVHETPHAIFRTLKYLKRIGAFDSIRALIFGEFIGELKKQRTKNQRSAIQKVLKTFAQECAFPVLQTHLIGHGKNNYPIAFSTAQLTLAGNRAFLSVWQNSQFIFLEKT